MSLNIVHFKTATRVLKKGRGRALGRIVSAYLDLHEDDMFDVSDAVSLLLLAHRSRAFAAHRNTQYRQELHEYYEAAVTAIFEGLNLSERDILLAVLARECGMENKFLSEYDVTLGQTEFEADRDCKHFVACHLLHKRSQLVNFQDEFGDSDPCDVWGTNFKNATVRAALEEVQSWYTRQADSMLLGILKFDRTLMRLMGWRKSKISLKNLRLYFQFPQALEL